MTIDQILIVIFGAPTIGLLTNIFFKMGKLEQAIEGQRTNSANLWNEINSLKEKLHANGRRNGGSTKH